MPPTHQRQDGLLARVNFPLYTVKMLTSRHVLVGGGGGSSKTGIANGFEIFEISHNGSQFVAQELLRHETGGNVVMNCTTHSSGRHSYLVAGQESHSLIYNVKLSVVNSSKLNNEKQKDEKDGVRKRKTDVSNGPSQGNTEPTKSDNQPKGLKFELIAGDFIQTDFSEEEPLQKVVRISHIGNLMATAGSDGHIRLWKFPKLEKCTDISAHLKEIDDVDFSLDDSKIVSVSKDGTAVVWSVPKGKKLMDLTWPVPNGSKYMYKRCRFSPVEEDPKKDRLFLLTNPIGRPGKLLSYLQSWDTDEGVIKKVASFNESLAALAVRDDGRFVAVGTMFSGSVYIFITFSLQKVLHVNAAHNMFVTGLEFLPVKTDKFSITSSAEASVVSISVDNRICIHSLYYRRSLPMWLVIIFIIMTLFLTFLFCSYLGL